MINYQPDIDHTVEISGYDSKGTFFVEWTILNWSRGKRKKLYLQRQPRVKSLAMLRSGGREVQPMLFRIVHVGQSCSGKSHEVTVAPVTPRTAPRERGKSLTASA